MTNVNDVFIGGSCARDNPVARVRVGAFEHAEVVLIARRGVGGDAFNVVHMCTCILAMPSEISGGKRHSGHN